MAGLRLISAYQRARPPLSRTAPRFTPHHHHHHHHHQPFTRPPTSRLFSSNQNASAPPSPGRSSRNVFIAGAAMGLLGFGAGIMLMTAKLPGLGSPLQLAPSESDDASGPLAYANRTEMLHAAEEIARLLGQDCVSYDTEVLEHHGHSDWSTSNSPERAVAVVYPRTTADVSLIARICTRRHVPMVPFGAGSSVEGNFSQPHSGICIDFSHMDQVVAFRPDDMDVTVQPGVNWVDLNARIASSGLFAPMDPSPTATVGGMVSTNCSGTNAFRYGTMRDWVLNLTVVLADGRVIRTRGGGRPRKSSAGYNLTSLFVGAEGTLGIVTEITLKLAPVPQNTSVAIVPFPTIRDAADAAASLIRSGTPSLAALEIMDDVQMRVLNEHGSAAVRKRKWAEQPTLFVKFSGTTDGIKGDVARVGEIVKGYSKSGFHFAQTKQEELDLWAARKEALFTMVSIKPKGMEMWSTDVAVPVSRLAEIIDWSKSECGKLGIFASVIGHVGDGNFHVAMMYDPKNEGQKEAVGRTVHEMMEKAIEMEGTVSGEHAIGIGKKGCLRDELGEDTIRLMKELKKAVDPTWVMNPGKVFD